MKTETKIETALGTVTVIRSPEYIWAGFDDFPLCPLQVEAFPSENGIGPIFFRSKNTLFHKREDETWETLWAELDPGWNAVAWFKALAGAAFPEAPQCNYCQGIPTPLAPLTGCTCGVSDAEFSEMWNSVAG